jgi:hypothetical protein
LAFVFLPSGIVQFAYPQFCIFGRDRATFAAFVRIRRGLR